MSNDLFIDAEKQLERLESLLPLVYKKYILTTGKDFSPSANGDKPPVIIYHGQIVFTRRDYTTGNFSVNGNSFPEVFKNLADQIS